MLFIIQQFKIKPHFENEHNHFYVLPFNIKQIQI